MHEINEMYDMKYRSEWVNGWMHETQWHDMNGYKWNEVRWMKLMKRLQKWNGWNLLCNEGKNEQMNACMHERMNEIIRNERS